MGRSRTKTEKEIFNFQFNSNTFIYFYNHLPVFLLLFLMKYRISENSLACGNVVVDSCLYSTVINLLVVTPMQLMK